MRNERKHYSIEEKVAVLGRHLLGLKFCLESIAIDESKGVGEHGARQQNDLQVPRNLGSPCDGSGDNGTVSVRPGSTKQSPASRAGLNAGIDLLC